MKKAKVQCIIILSILIGFTGINAQSLNIIAKTGIHTSYILSNIKQLTFGSGNMSVISKDIGTSVFPMINIRNMNFENITAVDEIKSERKSKLSLYPNPVLDWLNVQYEWTLTESILIQVIDIQGKIVYQHKQESITGTNQISISVDTFQKGLYLFRITNGEQTEIKKFIKY